MRVIITGATGFIGVPLARQLADDGYDVVALTRNKAKGQSLFGETIKAESWDGKTASGWGDLADGAFGIINLAGESIGAGRWTASRKQAIIESRLSSAAAVVEAIENASVKPRVLLQASGIGIYGDTGDRVADETSAPGKGFLADLAERWEAAVDPVKNQVRVASLRTSAVLGKGGGALAAMLPLFKAFLGGPLGSGNQYFPWIHLEDEIGAIRFLLNKEDAEGPYNLIAPESLRQKDFAKALGKTLGRPAVMPTPAFMMKLILGEMAEELLLTGQHAVPKRLLEAGYRFKFPEVESALRS